MKYFQAADQSDQTLITNSLQGKLSLMYVFFVAHGIQKLYVSILSTPFEPDDDPGLFPKRTSLGFPLRIWRRPLKV